MNLYTNIQRNYLRYHVIVFTSKNKVNTNVFIQLSFFFYKKKLLFKFTLHFSNNNLVNKPTL